MAETNVGAFWNSAGDLEFRQTSANNSSGPLLLRFNASNNGVDLQIARTAVLTSNGLALNANYYFILTDNTGASYYIPAADALW